MTNTASTPPGNNIMAATPPVASPTPPQSATTGSVGMTMDQVQNTWIQAGGNPQAAAMAAAVADAESGLNPGASRTNPDGTTSVGLWLIPANGTPPGSTDPVANARAAIQLSNNGTDWTQWCSTWSDNNCGQNNGTYLGSGANALMSLQTQLEPSSYQVFGSTPAGSGVGASSATSTPTTGGSKVSSTSKNILLLVVLVVVIAAVVYFSRKKAAQPEQDNPPSPEETPA